MTEDQPSTWVDFCRALVQSLPLGAAIWGAFGGAANAVVIRTGLGEAIRHISLGAIGAAGIGG